MLVFPSASFSSSSPSGSLSNDSFTTCIQWSSSSLIPYSIHATILAFVWKICFFASLIISGFSLEVNDRWDSWEQNYDDCSDCPKRDNISGSTNVLHTSHSSWFENCSWCLKFALILLSSHQSIEWCEVEDLYLFTCTYETSRSIKVFEKILNVSSRWLTTLQLRAKLHCISNSNSKVLHCGFDKFVLLEPLIKRHSWDL